MDNQTKIESKYERLRKIGTGSYGVVFKCVNRQNGQIVAIKRYSENDSDPIIRKIAMREVRMLRQLRHPNLINLIEVFRRKRRLHLVFDYCELTVLDVIEKYGNNCPLNLIKKIIWQTVNGINYCHTHNCIHRDIKPENILINQAGVVKLCDFGFARNFAVKPIAQSSGATPSGRLLLPCGANNTASKHRLQREADRDSNAINNKENSADQQQGAATSVSATATTPTDSLAANILEQNNGQALTEYVATRWYRAPELLIGEVYYDIKIDIWAIGCVAAELMKGDPIWPGKTDLDQLCIIKNSLGPLTINQTHTLLTQSIYDQASIERLLEQPANPNESLDRKLPSRVGQNGIDFVSTCLRMNPAKRPTSEELLKHIYIHSVRMTQFVKEANNSSTTTTLSSVLAANNNNHHQLVVRSPTKSTASVAKSTSYGHQLSTITKSRSNSQALKLATSTGANQQMVSSSSTMTTTISSILPALQPTKKLTMATANSNQLPSQTTPIKISSIPLAITKLPLNGHNKTKQQPQQQQQPTQPPPINLQVQMRRQQPKNSGLDWKGTSPPKYKRKHNPVNHNRTNLRDWN